MATLNDRCNHHTFNVLLANYSMKLLAYGVLLIISYFFPLLVSNAQAETVLEGSVHRGFGCQVCHNSPQGGGPAHCTRCHDHQVGAYMQDVHAKKNSKGNPNATCYDCHGSHDIRPVSDPGSMVSSGKLSKTCGACHMREKRGFESSIHEEIFQDDPASAPGCVTCHGFHGITRVREPGFVKDTVKTCGKCHEDAFEAYIDSLHGQVVTLEGGIGATCWDCHSSHDILEVSDPASPLSGHRKAHTCGKCHGRVTSSFMSYWPHASINDKVNYPLLYYAYKMMKLLFIVVMLTATIHTLAWLRAFPETVRSRIEKPKGRHYVYYLRFRSWHRLTHFVLFMSVIGLALSGLPLRYPATDWAGKISEILGGFSTIDLLHRCMAGLLFLAVVLHGYYLIKLVRKKGLRGFVGFLLSPDSLFPKIQDFKEAWEEFQCFLRGKREPQKDKWSYWEKFDYWAVFWGMIVIGGSGLMLAFPKITTSLFPGWVLNMALVFHSEEALLAIFFLFIFHFFHAHLRPLKFPIDETIFTGRISEEDFFHERQLEVARRSPEELEKMKVPPPNFFFRVAVYTVSFIAVDLGLVLIACILYTAWKTGTLLP